MSANGSRRALLAALAVAALLAACGGEDETPLPGERISVLTLERELKPDPSAGSIEVRLPAPQPNREWPQSGGYANHAMYHLALASTVSIAWRVSAGAAADDDAPLLNPPVTGEGRVYTVDAEGMVSAFDVAAGARLWEVELTPEEEEDSAFAGGLAYAGGLLVATTGTGEVVALEAANGRPIWSHRVGVPMRAAPTIAGGRVFVITYDNQIVALAAADGTELWTYQAIAESTGLVGNASAAVEGGTVVAPFSSGELVAIAVESGQAVWQDSLAGLGRVGGFRTLADIKGDPVIDRGIVLAGGHAGVLVAIDLRTGERVWAQNLSSLETPWVAGDFVYVLTTEGDLVCLTRAEGRVLWVQALPRWEDPEDTEEPINWAGPVLAGDRLIVTGTDGRVLSLSPYTGEVLGQIELPGPVRLAPIVAQGTVYILTDEAELLALR